MTTNHEIFINEIKDQLQDDILDYGWLCQMASDICPDANAKTISTMVFDAVLALVKTKEIVVGNTEIRNGILEVIPWSNDIDAISQQLRSLIEKAGDLPTIESDFCFWIQTNFGEFDDCPSD